MFGDVLWALELEKAKIWATFTLVGVAGLLPSLRVSCLDLSSARATFKRNNPSQTGGKMLVWIIKCENGATSVCLQVGVPRGWSSRKAMCIMHMGPVGYTYRHWALARITKVDPHQNNNKKSIPFIEPTKESNSSSPYYYFITLLISKGRKKTVAFELPWSKDWVDRCIPAMYLIDLCAHVLRPDSESTFSSRNSSALTSFLDFSSCVGWLALTLRRQPTFFETAWRDHCFPEPFSWFLHQTGLGSVKITSARCFSLKCQRKDSKKKAKEHRQFRGVLGRWCTAAIDCTTFRVCQRCRKTAVFAVLFSALGGIWRVKAFHDQQCQFLTRKKSPSSENESNCSMTSECVRTNLICQRCWLRARSM